MSNTFNRSNNRNYEHFIPANYPDAVRELSTIKQNTSGIVVYFKVEIIVSFLKKHALKVEWIDANPALTRMVTSGFLKTVSLESLFDCYRDNNTFINDFEGYIGSELLMRME